MAGITSEELSRLLDGSEYALIVKEGSESIDVLIGHTIVVDDLHDIPLREEQLGADVLALIPFRQVRERGFQCQDDDTPLVCLVVEQQHSLSNADFLAAFPERDIPLSEQEFDLSDDEYAEVVSRIIEDEIGRGEGANFVIRRTLKARIPEGGRQWGLSLFRNLLAGERGAYWTFYVQTNHIALIGASPERHISSDDGVVRMNPISGTYRLPVGEYTQEELQGSFTDFLRDEKEILELMMVVDEELKMMAALCPGGGKVIGPFLKPMTHLIHTEYLLEGESELSAADLLRDSMFAATVVGSPVENACRIIKKYESTGRGYYGAVLALIGRDAAGRQTLDAPILIRTAAIDNYGNVAASVGATLVRNSDPVSEVSETKSKIAGLLSAFTPSKKRTLNRSVLLELASANQAELTVRNSRLSPFWSQQRETVSMASEFAGLNATLISAEDDFSKMLAHLLGSMGVTVQQITWQQVAETPGLSEVELLILGPGPGDPRDSESPRIATMRALAAERLASGKPLLGICLGHQILSAELGLKLRLKNRVLQGSQEVIDFFGEPQTVGFYNTFTAELPMETHQEIEFATQGDEIIAMRGSSFASLQFHPESILTLNSQEIVAATLSHLFR